MDKKNIEEIRKNMAEEIRKLREEIVARSTVKQPLGEPPKGEDAKDDEKKTNGRWRLWKA
jgi:hypothetical protein